MRHFTMYIDESGKANLADTANSIFLLTGLIVEDKTDSELSSYFKFIKRRYGFNENESLHAYDMFENPAHSLHLSDNSRCKQFTSSIVEFVENAPFYTFVFYINKNELRNELGAPEGYSFNGSQKHKEDKDVAYEILGRKLIFEFASILKKEKAIGTVVAESRRGADNVLLRAYLDTQEPQTFSANPKIAKNSELSRDYVHSICFAGKKSLKSGLELADIVSYLAFNELNKKFPSKRSDKKGLKDAWSKIKLRIIKKEPQKVTVSQLQYLVPDRIDEISKRIKQRLREFRDLVNPTQR